MYKILDSIIINFENIFVLGLSEAERTFCTTNTITDTNRNLLLIEPIKSLNDYEVTGIV